MSLSCQNTKTKLENPFIDNDILKEDNFIERDDDVPEPNDKIKITRKRYTYTIEEKLFFVKLMEAKSQHSIAEEYNIPEKNLRRWKSQSDKLQLAKYKKISRNIRESDKKPGVERKTAIIENDLLSYIKL